MEMNRLRDGVPDLLGRLREAGYSERYVVETRRFAKRLLAAAPGLADWDEATEWAHSLRPSARKTLNMFLRTCRHYEEGIMPGEAPRHDPVPTSRDGLCEGFAKVIDAYEASPEAAAKSPSSLRVEVSCTSAFLAGLEALGRSSVDEVTEDDVIGVLTDGDGGPAHSPAYARHLRAVLGGASGEVGGCERLMGFVPVPRAWRKSGRVLTPDEVEAVCRVLDDPQSPVSLRDRAIVRTMMLTGLRSCDVAALGVDSIDWNSGTISIVQQKTGTPLELPLPTQVGNDIFEYATRERPLCGDPHVFITRKAPHGPIGSHAVRAAAAHVYDVAGVEAGPTGVRGSHAFRRTAITSMISDGVDRAVVASVAGHASPDTTDGYMVASVEGLRRHASLDVGALAATGEGVR